MCGWEGGGVDELGHLEDEVHLFILKMTLFMGQELLRAQQKFSGKEENLSPACLFSPSPFWGLANDGRNCGFL